MSITPSPEQMREAARRIRQDAIDMDVQIECLKERSMLMKREASKLEAALTPEYFAPPTSEEK